jgi:large subunit ribosomal protein L15
MPLVQRIPKLRGFTNPFRVEYQGINLDVIEQSEMTDVSPQTLYTHRLGPQGAPS